MLPPAAPAAPDRAPGEIADGTWRSIDTVLLAALAVACIFLIRMQMRWSYTPVEDASMLLRYAQNFAQGYGLRWNIHQPPVDGATDFLYCVAIGLLSRFAHIDVIASSRILNLSAHVATVLFLFAAGRRLLGANRWICAGFAAYLAAGPAVDMAVGCFGAPCFALLLTLCWASGIWYGRFKPTWPVALCMSVLGLLAGLTRPEGVLIAILILFVTVYLTLTPTSGPNPSPIPGPAPWKSCIPIVVTFTLVFAILGGTYFAWHWKYFGYPLPNPFYIKGNGHLYPYSLHAATFNLIRMLAPAFPLLPLGWLSPGTRRLTTALAVFTLCFTFMWVFLLDVNNHFGRFQYAIVPLFLFTIPALATQAGVLLRHTSAAILPSARRWIIPAAGVLALASGVLYVNHLYGTAGFAWGMRAFGRRLQPLAANNYTMVVTEAGALPLYSQWQTIDGLGLNDAYVAHAPEHHLSAAYLDRFHPEIIMVHIDFLLPAVFAKDGIGRTPEPGSGGWNQEFLNYYAKSHGYTLAAVYGSGQCNFHIYWVRPGFPDYNTVLSDIRDYPYFFLDSGILTHDYRDQLDSLQACTFPVEPY